MSSTTSQYKLSTITDSQYGRCFSQFLYTENVSIPNPFWYRLFPRQEQCVVCLNSGLSTSDRVTRALCVCTNKSDRVSFRSIAHGWKKPQELCVVRLNSGSSTSDRVTRAMGIGSCNLYILFFIYLSRIETHKDGICLLRVMLSSLRLFCFELAIVAPIFIGYFFFIYFFSLGCFGLSSTCSFWVGLHRLIFSCLIYHFSTSHYSHLWDI